MDLLTDAEGQVERAARTTLPEALLAQRQAAEKTWGFVASEVNHLLRSAGFSVRADADAHQDRRDWLEVIDREAGTDLARRHDQFARLHGQCFYDGRCPPPAALATTVQEARRFVEDVRTAVTGVRRHGRPRP